MGGGEKGRLVWGDVLARYRGSEGRGEQQKGRKRLVYWESRETLRRGEEK